MFVFEWKYLCGKYMQLEKKELKEKEEHNSKLASDLVLDEIVINETKKSFFSVHMLAGAFVADWHDHDKHQLLYAEGGALRLQTIDHSFLLPARHAAWIPAKCLHTVSSSSPELYLRMLYFDGEEVESTSLQKMSVFPINNLAREMIYQTRVWNYSFDESDNLEKAFYKTLRLFVAQWASVSMPLSLPMTSHPKLKPVMDYIAANLEKDLYLETVAKEFAMSKRTLMRLFQHEIATTYGTFLRITRIISALELLNEPGANVSSVAFAVGYESISAFSSTFQQLVGMRPQEYLKKSMVSSD